PAPGVAAHLVDAELRFPAQLPRGERRIGIARGDIAGAPRQYLVGNLLSAGALECLHCLEYRVAAAGAEVHGDRAALLLEVLERGDMPEREVHDVEVIAHAGAVLGVVVAAPDAQRAMLADGDLRDIREEIIRDAARVLADASRRMSPGRVE